MNFKQIQLPLSKAEARELKAGDACLLSGVVYVLRDKGHARLLEEASRASSLPFGLSGQTIFYSAPTPSKGGHLIGAIGPTVASRMDFATPTLLAKGLTATIGMGPRSEEVHKACKEYSSVYFVATGEAAALMAQCVVSDEVVAYDDLGPEALRRIEVKDLPVFVGIDVQGNDIYALEA